MKNSRRNIALGTALAVSFWSPEKTLGESYQRDATEVIIAAQPASEPVLAVITNPEQNAVNAKHQVLKKLEDIGANVTEGVNPVFAKPEEIILSQKPHSDCALQIGFSFDQTKKLANVVFQFAAPPDVFRGSDHSYTTELYGGTYPHQEVGHVEGFDFNPDNQQSIQAALGFISSLTSKLCPIVKNATQPSL